MAAVDIFVGVSVCLILLCGAIWDARRRIIPDFVPIALGALGLILVIVPDISYWQVPLLERIAGLALPTATMLILHLLKKPVGGGDFKLSAALGFLLGLTQFAVAFVIGGVMALIWAAVKKQKSAPLAVFLAIGVAVCLML